MPNRLDIELTSVRGDGSYTWRAAGARQPKGVVDAKILSDSAKVGDVLRVEAEVEIDGITILSVLPPKEKAEQAGRIELLGSSKPVAAVTTVLVSEGGRGRGDRRDLLDSPRRNDRPGTRDRRPSRAGERPDTRRPHSGEATSEPGARRPERRPRTEGAQAGEAPPGSEGRTPRSGADRRPERRPRLEATPGGAPSSGASSPAGQRRPRTPSGTGPRPGAPSGERTRTEAGRPPAGRPVTQSAPRRVPRASSREPPIVTSCSRAWRLNSDQSLSVSPPAAYRLFAGRSPKSANGLAPKAGLRSPVRRSLPSPNNSRLLSNRPSGSTEPKQRLPSSNRSRLGTCAPRSRPQHLGTRRRATSTANFARSSTGG